MRKRIASPLPERVSGVLFLALERPAKRGKRRLLLLRILEASSRDFYCSSNMHSSSPSFKKVDVFHRMALFASARVLHLFTSPLSTR